TQIRAFLDWDICVNSALVEVRTNEQVEHLSGTVGTATEKARIIATAYQSGATRVDARDLFVAYWALGREIRREKFAPKTDESIAEAVRDTFRHNPRVWTSETMVQVHHGVVTLAGTVGNLRTKQHAEQDARHVVGVVNVHNLMKVRPARLVPDEDIRNTITAALARDPYLSSGVVGVQVQGGKALLTGHVNSPFEQERAEDVAAGISGVVDVNNRLDIASTETIEGFTTSFLGEDELPATASQPDHALAERIRARYGWSANLHDQGVEVHVENGRATLSGTVDTWLHRKEAALVAHEAGSREVNNHLCVLNAAPSVNRELLASHELPV
ncbi:MAG: hypothetical protein JWR44_3431, partial [Hymenobacter sp.]|nr:hypothetical protein [Hymenobacter sp.]